LKPFLAVLDKACLPVPSLLLNGPGNMPGCVRFDYDFAGLLEGTLSAAAARDERVVVFVGYLARAAQVTIVLEAIARHRAQISAIVVDPVSGDEGRAYVHADLIAAWPALLAIADWALPNVTEAALFSGVVNDNEAAVAALRTRFPRPGLVVTGWEEGEQVGTRCLLPEGETHFSHRRINRRFNGTGDLFAALWVERFFLKQTKAAEATKHAAEGVLGALDAAVETGSADVVVVRQSAP
jgi:pyridoxine kinase